MLHYTYMYHPPHCLRMQFCALHRDRTNLRARSECMSRRWPPSSQRGPAKARLGHALSLGAGNGQSQNR
jgi:hypothetical protein